MSGDLLGYASLTIIALAGVGWLRGMQRVRLPADATGYLVACGAGALLGSAALLAGTGFVAGLAAAFAILGGLAFLALFAASGQRRGTIAVAVGRPIIDFTASDDEGRPFALASLRGRPVLLKFFRGHWCPYCVAELRRWGELHAELDAHDVAIVAVCADTAAAIRKGRVKHGLRATMLPDPDLVLTDRYGLRNPKNFAPKPGVIIPLPIPTTILVDADGIVCWIDQSTDYMRRSDPDMVRAALHATLGPARTETPIAAPPAARAAAG